MNYINCTDTLFPLSLPPIVDLKQVTRLSACEVLIWINVFGFCFFCVTTLADI